LEELGIKSYVVQPQDVDERGKAVKNVRLDAAAMCQRLDRFERGNKKAFSTVRIPTLDEEPEAGRLKPYNVICFHCQQAGEKWLKARLCDAPKNGDADRWAAVERLEQCPRRVLISIGNRFSLGFRSSRARYRHGTR
jgi:hypothetical protein